MNLTALEVEIVKTEKRLVVYQEKIKELKQRKTDEENLQIIKIVRSANMSIKELKEMFATNRPGQIKEDEINV